MTTTKAQGEEVRKRNTVYRDMLVMLQRLYGEHAYPIGWGNELHSLIQRGENNKP